MAKFPALWEVDTTKVPEKPEKRHESWTMKFNMVKKDMESGGLMDWGCLLVNLQDIPSVKEREIALECLKI